MNITITGNLGSGKSSVCKELEKSGFTVISAGDIFRELAAEKGMTVIELNEAAKKDRSIDDMLDNRSTELGKKMDRTVFDSRLAWHFVENSFKVFLLVDTQEAARRVFNGDNRSAEAYQTVEEAQAGLEERASLEQERFWKLYGIDYYDVGNYDLVIESTCASPEDIAQEIQRNFARYQAQPFSTKVELNLKCLYPSVPFHKMKESGPADAAAEETEEKQGLCADAPFMIIEKNGYHYVQGDYGRALAAAAAGRVFAKISDIRADEEARRMVEALSEDDIARFEQAGKFCYPGNPVRMPEKTGYMADFSKVFH